MIRAAPALITLVLIPLAIAAAGCRRDAGDDAAEVAPVASAAAPPLACALDGARTFGEDCTIERIASATGWTLVVHHPDGGFRRLDVATDGRGVVTADGAQAATVTVIDPATIEVAVAGDRYRLPATIKGAALPTR